MRRIEITKGAGPITITKQWIEDGTVVDAGAVTFDLSDADAVSQQSGSATKTGTGTSTKYTVVVAQARNVEVEEYEIVWTRTATSAVQKDSVGIVGSLLFTEAQARDFEIMGGQKPISDADFSDTVILEARYRIAELLEQRLGVSLIRRFARARIAGNGKRALPLVDAEATHGGAGYRRRPLTLIRGTVNGTALTTAEIADIEVDSKRHRLTRFTGDSWSGPTGDQPPRNVILSYEYGTRDVPWEVNRAALVLLVASVVPSDVSKRMTSFSNPDGTFRLSTPSLRTPTGLPEVDELITALDDRLLFA